MKYHDDLIKDRKRVEAFNKTIDNTAHGIVYDLGTGSGLLAKRASRNSDKVIAIEINPRTYRLAKNNLSQYDNIEVICADASNTELDYDADVVICEMLDTALIDEEQVPVINNILKYTNDQTTFIPKAVINTITLTYSKVTNITYIEDNKPHYEEISDEITYQKVYFNKKIKKDFDELLSIHVNNTARINSIKLTTYTLMEDGFVLEPTPMLNPPLIIPIDEIPVEEGQTIRIQLKYIMGGGLNTITTAIK